jgi:hypothetical protein
MIQEGGDEGAVENLQRQLRGWFVQLAVCKPKKQTEAVTVRSDSVGTGLSLIDQPVGEKGLKQGG